MGCDIHVHVEKYGPVFEEIDGVFEWQMVPAPEIELFKKADGSPYLADYWYFGRNYRLFGWLADVRNEMSWGTSRVEPLSQPRGLPDDVSAGIAKESDDWGVDGHSHSYFTLREMVQAMEAQPETIVENRGWVNGPQYVEYLENGSPSSWCGSVGGGGVKHVSETEMHKYLLRDGAGAHRSTYTEIRWNDVITESLSGDWKEFIDRLLPLTRGDGSDVRIVFWFDN